MSKAEEALVVMGRITAPFGIKGWVKIQADTEYPDSLFNYPELHVGREGAWQIRKVEAIEKRPDGAVVKFVGFNDRDQAFTLRGQLAAVRREEMPDPEEDTYYWADLIGMAVIGIEGVSLGTVRHLFETGSNDVMVVKGEDGIERLIPFVAAVIEKVDTQNRTISAQWGLDY